MCAELKYAMKNESANTIPARRRIRRQFDPNHPLKHQPSILLGHEDAESFQTVRQAVNDEFSPMTNYQQFLSEIAAQNMWRILRSAATESAHLDIEIAENAPQVDRLYEDIDGHARTALALRDQSFSQAKRLLNQEESVYTRRHFLVTAQLRRSKG